MTFLQILFPLTPSLVNVNLGVVGTFAYDRCIQNVSVKTELGNRTEEEGELNDDVVGGLESSEAGLVLSVMGLANCCGRIGFGQALDWWKDKVKVFPRLFITSIEICRVFRSF